jgi:O-antigen/teichoic acid export membrane protein
MTGLFPTPLLQVFGDEVVAARGALVALSIAMLATAPVGPVASVILMSGRSRQAMTNTLVLMVINIGGNLILVPRWGITAAGVTWGLTIVVAAALPGWQAHHSLGVSTLGRPAFMAVATAATTIGVVAVAARVWLGDTGSGLLATATIGMIAYAIGLRRMSPEVHLDALWDGVRRRS